MNGLSNITFCLILLVSSFLPSLSEAGKADDKQQLFSASRGCMSCHQGPATASHQTPKKHKQQQKPTH